MKLNTYISIVLLIALLTISIFYRILLDDYDNLFDKHEASQVAHLEASQELIKEINHLQLKYSTPVSNNVKPVAVKSIQEDWTEFVITAYTCGDPTQNTTNTLATGFNTTKTRVANIPIVASDDIPLYTIIEIEDMGAFIVLDRMSVSGSQNGKIDILFEDKDEAVKFGRQTLNVRILN